MSAIEGLDLDLQERLQVAVAACQQALADYGAGLLDEDEVREALVAAGLVHRPGEAWVLDLAGDRWCRYDGVGLDVSTALSDAGVRRLRDVIDGLKRPDDSRG